MTPAEICARIVRGDPPNTLPIENLAGDYATLGAALAGANGSKADVLTTAPADLRAEVEAAIDALTFEDDAQPTSAAQPAQQAASGLPRVVVGERQLRDMATEVMAALETANIPPAVFVRGGALTRVVIEESGKARLERYGESALCGRMSDTADFKRTFRGNEFDTTPPLGVVRYVLTRSEWPNIPALTGLLEAPALRPDGSVITAPGFDLATGLYYRPAKGLTVPEVPNNPTRAEISAARDLLREPFYDFPYVAEADRTNAQGLLLTLITRPAIPGPVPLALVGAPQQGTGKGLHAEISSLVATDRPATMAPLPYDKDELQKQIFANLLAGETLICFDNVEGRIASPVLSRALTASEFGGRILGQSAAPGLPQRATWIATGNAIQLGGDLARRCYPINLDAKMSNPWERTGWRHPNLLEWVRGNRSNLIWAALTLARAWYAAGCPAAKSPVIGSFEGWCRVIGGILEYAGARDFLGNLKSMYESADEEGRQWEAFVLALAAKFAGPTLISEVCKTIESDTALQEVVPDIGEEALDQKGNVRPKFKQSLGFAFRKRMDRRHGQSQARIEREPTQPGTQTRVARWLFKTG